MRNLVSVTTKVVIGAIAVGGLSLGTAGITWAASTTTVPKHVNCANAAKALTRIEKTEARAAARLSKLLAAEAKAQKAGNTERVDHVKTRIAHLESPAFKARLAKRTSAIETKCHIAAPTATGGLSANPVTQA